jgi:hypothetical protein
MPELSSILKNVVLFKDLTETELNLLAQRVTTKTYPLGSYLFHAGTSRTEMFVIQAGEVEILRGIGDIQRTVARIGEGNFVGEGAMLDEDEHTNSCRAVIESRVLALERQTVEDILKRSPDVAGKIFAQVARVMAYRLKYASFGYRGAAVAAPAGGKKRLEHDLLGEREVPADAYFGIQTLRALENYDITGIPLSHFPNFVKALAMVKKAAAKANQKLGDLDKEVGEAIGKACDEISTGITAKPEYSSLAIEELSRIAKFELVQAENLMEATSDMGAFVMFSSVLKRIAVKISKICNDLRLLSSGPRAGLNEINLPPMAPGSSIMPGKVNPVIPEVVNQVAFQVIGNDLTVTMAAEAGQLQLNVMEPVLAFNCFQSLKMLTQAINTLTQRCIKGITANRERCRDYVANSIGIVTALVPHIGYENATRIAKRALETNRSVMDLVLGEGLLSQNQLEDILSPQKMTQPRI